MDGWMAAPWDPGMWLWPRNVPTSNRLSRLPLLLAAYRAGLR